jgi:hypothetical protein
MNSPHPIPDDLGILLPEQQAERHATHLPMARVAAAVLIDAVRCLHQPPASTLHRDALRYLLGPAGQEVMPCDRACELADIDPEHLRRRLRAAGYRWSETPPPRTRPLGKARRAA